MSVDYSKFSQYYETPIYSNSFLDLYEPRQFPRLEGDVAVTLTEAFKHKPHLLAYELYGDSRLWWVFAARNPNLLKDPIFDFLPGRTIYIPRKDELVKALGL